MPRRKARHSKDIHDPAVFNAELTQRLAGVREEQQRQEMHLQERHRQVQDTRRLLLQHRRVPHLQFPSGLHPAPGSQADASIAAIPQAASTGVAHGQGQGRGHIYGQGQPWAHTHIQTHIHFLTPRPTQGQGVPHTHSQARSDIYTQDRLRTHSQAPPQAGSMGGQGQAPSVRQDAVPASNRPHNMIRDGIDNYSNFTFFGKSQILKNT